MSRLLWRYHTGRAGNTHSNQHSGVRAGESMPAKMLKGGQPKMGSTVVKGEVEATVQVSCPLCV